MKALSTMKQKVLVAVVALALAVGMGVLAGCACSSTATNSSSASSAASNSSTAAVTVPNVVSLTQNDAEKAITSAGLVVGDVTRAASNTVPSGHVISQDPAALAQAKAGDKVNFVVSSGKETPIDVTVPDLKGKTQAEAEKLLKDANLVGVASNPEESDAVSPGQVFKQSVEAGTTVKEGTKVAFTVALAPAESTVPYVVGKTQDDAKAAITDAKLGYDHTTAYSDSVAEGTVISQSIGAGSKVKSGTTVSVVVSLGAKPVSDVKVPDVATYSWQDAEAALLSAGLKARYTGDPNGYVVSQDVAAGTMVAPGTLVTVSLAGAEPPQNPIMNFIGNYSADRANITVEASGDDGAKITVEWGSSVNEGSRWTMTGTFDEKTLTVNYKDGTRIDYVYDDAEHVTETTVYTDGTGTFTFKDATELTLTWDDKKEDVAKGMTFVYGV